MSEILKILEHEQKIAEAVQKDLELKRTLGEFCEVLKGEGRLFVIQSRNAGLKNISVDKIEADINRIINYGLRAMLKKHNLGWLETVV